MATEKIKWTLDSIRRNMTPFQKGLLQEIWQHYRTKRQWPILRALSSKHNSALVRDALTALGGDVGREEIGPQGWSLIQLTLLGVLLTNDGVRLQALMAGFFLFQRDLYQKEPEKYSSTNAEIQAALNLSKEDTSLLGLLLLLGSFAGGHSNENDSWNASAMQEAVDFPTTGELSDYFSEWICRFYNPETPAFSGQRNPRFANEVFLPGTPVVSSLSHPVEIAKSLERLHRQYPDPEKLGFLIMRFTQTKPFERIVSVIKSTAARHDLVVIRADDCEFHADLWGNVRTLLHGCGFGIAVYERIEKDEPNANIGLEVGYLMAMNKPVLLLKDKTVPALPSDLTGKLYRLFDPHDPDASIPEQVKNWFKDNAITVPKRP